MSFEYDLFISYSGHDNKPLENEKGWVTNFSHFLDIALERLLKRRPRILMSHDLEGSQFAKTPPVELFSKTSAFISIVSPEYVKSKHTHEIEDFITSAEYNGGIEIAGLSRLYKVIKMPVPTAQQPVSIQKILNYDFFDTTSAATQTKEFTSFFDLKIEFEFWALLVDLAYDIRNLISVAELNVKNAGAFDGTTIYLNELRGFTSKYRNSIKRELQKFGHKVVPERPMDKASNNYKSEAKNYIDKSVVSIYLLNDDEIGRNEQAVIEAQNEFISDFDNRLAKSGGTQDKIDQLPKLVWISPEIKPENEKQKTLIEQLKKEIEAISGAEIIQAPFEVFKSVVHEKIKRNGDKPKRVKNNSSYIYLIHSIADKNNVLPIVKSLTDKGFEVLTPLFEGDILHIVENHRQNLVECDAVIIYYGKKATDQWLQSKLIDMQKAPGFGRTKPLLAKAVYVSAELKSEKYIEQHGLISISGKGDFSDGLLTPFTETIKQ